MFRFLVTTLFILLGAQNANAALTNLALNGVASQSSTKYSGAGNADHGIDGNTNGDWDFSGNWMSNPNNSLTHTQLEQSPWWQVDLGSLYRLDLIKVWNRTDWEPDALSDFTVSVLDDTGGVVWDTFFAGAAGTTEDFDLTGLSVIGQIINVQLSGAQTLHLAEVQVFGDPTIGGEVLATPVPAAVWLFGTGIIGLLRLSKQKKRHI